MFIFLFLEWKFCITMESSPNEPIPLTATANPVFCNMWTKAITAASVWYLEKNQLKFDYFLWNACSENPLSSTYLRKRVHFLN